jgi:gliding motility-associated protein GldL
MTGTVGTSIPAVKSSKVTETHNESLSGGQGVVIVGGENAGGGLVNPDDAARLSESIQQLSKTSEMIGEFSNASTTTQKLNKNLETAAELTSKYLNSQEALIMAANKLQSTYEMIDAGMEGVERNTQIYAGKIEDIHKTLASINSIYEIHLNNIHTQTENWNQQAEAFKDVTEDIREVAQGMSKIKDVSVDALAETEKFKNSSRDLTEKIEELNKVYGNMLNALN